MKKIMLLCMALSLLLLIGGCFSKEELKINSDKEKMIQKEDEMQSIKITIKEQVFYARMYDNTAVEAFFDRLPMTLTMDELHGNEKYHYVTDSLPTKNQKVSQIYTGDLKLFGNDCLVLFYQDFATSYSYTNLGQILNPQGLAEALGKGSVEVHFDHH